MHADDEAPPSDRLAPIEESAVLRGAVRSQMRLLVPGTALLVGHQVGEALVPVIVGVLIDQAVLKDDGGALVQWLIVLAVVFAFLSTSWRFGARLTTRAAQNAGHELRVAVTTRVLHPRGGADRGQLSGELVNTATSDADRVADGIDAVAYGIATAAALVVGSVVLLDISLPLGLLVLCSLPPLLFGVRRLARPLSHRNEEEQARAAHATGVASDLMSGLRIVKGLGAEQAAWKRYVTASRSSLDATVRAARAEAAFEGASLAFVGVALAIVALIGGRLATEGDISIGDLVAALGVTQFLVGPITGIGYVVAEWTRSQASARRVSVVMSTDPAVAGGSVAPTTPALGHLDVRDLAVDGLEDLTFTARPGELLAIAVEDPANAAALIECLARDRDPSRGTITLDTAEIQSMDPDQLREVVLVAQHDADLFEGSLLDNVTLGAGAGPATDAAIAAAGADEVGEAIGPDATISDRGRNLSGGQRQRVALARALAAEPDVLVLHDPTTAVDAVTEARIASGLQALRVGHTTIILTTSPTLLGVADRVLLVTSKVIAEGRHADLLASEARYRDLVLA